MDMVQDTAEFFLVSVERKYAVKYHCRYRVLEPPGTSEKSDAVELVVTDPKLPPPSNSMSSGSKVGTGTNVTIWCSNQENRGTIFLHKDGHSAPIQLQDPSGGGTATFTLFGVTPSDSGTYRCSYRFGGFYLLSSPLRDSVTLEVTP
ncbi:osteoclast-associated immunoglobulin-like receptor, partial [Phasianus colchicus]|uniref:osteoclast-associated immunoglobulin-like receptor n=1 Tax=Phasianus colchicus TaxID=9054 RepID=UPI00129DFF99